jgi:FkbM family methyltransferase
MKIKDTVRLYNILSKNGLKDITLYDIGAEGGPNSIWDYDFIQIIGFEPEKVEYEKLISRKKTNEKYYNAALSSKEGTIKINVCRKQNCSSILKPNRKYLNDYINAARFDVIEEYECTSTTIENIAKIDGRKIDIIKVDTQGSELDILLGAKQHLNNVLFIEIETEFNYFYENQPTFSEVHSFMLKNGFRLFDIQKVLWHRGTDLSFKNSKGELIFCNSYYFKDINHLDFSLESNRLMLLKQIWIAFNMGFINYSYFLVNEAKIHLDPSFVKEIKDFFIELLKPTPKEALNDFFNQKKQSAKFLTSRVKRKLFGLIFQK